MQSLKLNLRVWFMDDSCPRISLAMALGRIAGGWHSVLLHEEVWAGEMKLFGGGFTINPEQSIESAEKHATVIESPRSHHHLPITRAQFPLPLTFRGMFASDVVIRQICVTSNKQNSWLCLLASWLKKSFPFSQSRFWMLGERPTPDWSSYWLHMGN